MNRMNPFLRAARKLRQTASIAKLHANAVKHSLDLKLQQNNLSKIRPDDIILFSVMKNETCRLDYFLNYYRTLGVNHFVIVDNNSTDGFDEFVSGQNDITVYRTAASYKNANFGVHWCNHLLSKHGVGHWCVTCDPDEFLVYPKIDMRNLRELTRYLDANYLCSFYTLMIDMYGKNAVEDTAYLPGQDPLEVCPYLDRLGYNKDYWRDYAVSASIGGVRRRVFFKSCADMSPSLNKVPLVKWKKHYVYLSSTHVVRPNYLNDVCRVNYVTGALLHFKFISQLQEKVEEERHAKQHWDDSFEYRKYDEVLQQKTNLYDDKVSKKYESWETLVDLGLINMGGW